MNNDLKLVLMNEFDYTEYEANLTVEDMKNCNSKLAPILKKWLDDRTIEDYSVGEYSINRLIEEHHMTFPQAFIMLNWMIDDYVTALKCLNSPRR